MGTLLIVVFAASLAGFITSTVVLFKLLSSKKGAIL
jgi:hypothetical protein